MAFFTEVEGVLFTEDMLNVQVIGEVSFIAPTQNTTLATVKLELARQARNLGANGVIGYNYKQKADTPFKNVFSFRWDTERISASGFAVIFVSDPRV